MGSTFHSLHYHVVFSTKERRPFIDGEWRKDLHAYLGGIIRGLGGVAEAVGGVEDHVHLLISLKTTDAPANVGTNAISLKRMSVSVRSSCVVCS